MLPLIWAVSACACGDAAISDGVLGDAGAPTDVSEGTADDIPQDIPAPTDQHDVGPAADVAEASTEDTSEPSDAAPVEEVASPPTDYCSLGASVFDETVVHEISLQLSDADWSALITEAVDSPEYGGPKPTYFDADLTYDGAPLPSPVAVRIKGHYSLLVATGEGHSFPLKLDFDRVDPELHLEGLTKLNLHPNLEGNTVLNELLSYGALRAQGIPTARVGLARVTVNGEDLGLYALVEHLQGKFIKCNFEAPYGDLYKPEEPIGNLAWRGPALSDYEPEIQFKWPDVSVTDHASVLALLDTVNHQDISAFGDVLDITGVLTYLAANVAVGNFDYYATFGHNYYLYEATPGRFTMLPWDMNLSQNVLEGACGLGRNTEEWPITHKLLADPATVQQYVAIMKTILDGEASVESLTERLDAALLVLADHIDPDDTETLRHRIETRVDMLHADIEAGVDVCPAVPLEGGDDDECGGCLDDECGDMLWECFEDEGCDCMLECVGDDEQDDEEEDECLEACELDETPDLLDDVVDCAVSECADQCL